ncbi:MAG TPA: Glu/Leu/Phe/Val dehydrogenase dimerization domain-containing protein [Gemmatimonadaceae bacterium]|nr:Glu/Leu/Phe/Val dehydrogenase dimerization domain-containing protein [Gemmatimonadaceae bacterium]
MSLQLTKLDSPRVAGYEEVWVARDSDASYHAILAIHNTQRGPALGGTRLMRYANDDAALTDVLRLARGMTYKCAAANIPLGGGKSVILEPPSGYDRAALLRAHGRAVESLNGRYITSVDIGTGPVDMVTVRETTTHVTGLPNELDDPSPVTARGVVCAIEAARFVRTGSRDLHDVRIAIQGCGHVGKALALQLHALGARLVVSDVSRERVDAVVAEIAAEVCRPDEIHDARADVYAPCATGATLNARTIPRLEVSAVAGAANNQLETDADGDALRARGITYVPDFIANAGGAIYLCRVLAGWTDAETDAAVKSIFDSSVEVLRHAEREGISAQTAAERVVEARLGIGA